MSRFRLIRTYERRIVASEATHRRSVRHMLKRARAESRSLGKSLKRLVRRSAKSPIGAGWTKAFPEADVLARKIGRPSRVMIDVTSAYRGRFGGGILRASQTLATEMVDFDEALPVVFVDDRLVPLSHRGGLGTPLSFRPSDTYVVFDTFWDPLDAYAANLEAARAAGARTVLCIYDVVPLIFPGLVQPHYVRLFETALRRLLPLSDAIVTISRSSAREIRRALRRRGYGSRKVVWFHLGADAFAQPRADRSLSSRRPGFLSVGTLEPKKGYDIALDAFDRLWAVGVDAAYTIVGRRGWLCDALVERIIAHPEYGSRLIWLQTATDHDLRIVMAQSHALIQASVAEGFGIPLVEASCQGLPVIASDLPVFREISGTYPRYFRVCDSTQLARRIEEVIADPRAPTVRPILGWARSARWLLAELKGLSRTDCRARRTGRFEPRTLDAEDWLTDASAEA